MGNVKDVFAGWDNLYSTTVRLHSLASSEIKLRILCLDLGVLKDDWLLLHIACSQDIIYYVICFLSYGLSSYF